jgi:hypothetical protein
MAAITQRRDQAIQMNSQTWKEPESQPFKFSPLVAQNCVKATSMLDDIEKASVLDPQLKRLLPPFVMNEMQLMEEQAKHIIQQQREKMNQQRENAN